MSTTAFIYIVGVTTNPVKIGRALDVRARLSSLQIGCPDELLLHHTFKVPAHLAEDVEKHLHVVLRAHHRRGEWFDIDAAQAYEVVLREGTRRIAFAELLAGRWRAEVASLHDLEWGPLASAEAVAQYMVETDQRLRAEALPDPVSRGALEDVVAGRCTLIGRPDAERKQVSAAINALAWRFRRVRAAA